jgi:hypothetical protein
MQDAERSEWSGGLRHGICGAAGAGAARNRRLPAPVVDAKLVLTGPSCSVEKSGSHKRRYATPLQIPL